jgi:signal transduction histidine kinase
MRLTLTYGGLFVLCAAALLVILNLAARIVVIPTAHGELQPTVTRCVRTPTASACRISGSSPSGSTLRALVNASQVQLRGTQRQLAHVLTVVAAQPASESRTLLVVSLVGFGVMAVVSIWLGWLVAGRVLSPLRTITAAAREISATDLHRRLSLAGPDDELRELGDTFDELLARLEAAFEAQRQFVANASHELRTPLARQRTLAEVALGDAEATVESLRASHARLIAAGEEQEDLIEALLTLARSERGPVERQPFDLAVLAEGVLAGRQADIRRRRLHLEAQLEPAVTLGEPRLAERLIANLVDNAIRYNRRGGSLRVVTAKTDAVATVSVTNSGPVVPPDQVVRLLQPFQRLSGTRATTTDGSGLGLSIADAIARAHGGSLTVEAQPEGGLAARANFPVT